MSKGPRIPDHVRLTISNVYLDHPDWTAKEIQKEVNARLRKKNPRLKDGWPGLSAVQKELTDIRKNKPVEKPWSMATLDKDEYPMPPEAVAAVLKVWKFRFENNDSFTIREAKWAARLSGIKAGTEWLAYMSREYARLELSHDLLGLNFDSGGLDRLVMELPLGDMTSDMLAGSLLA